MSRAFETVSPSMIDTFRGCARKFWFRYKAGMRPPPSPAMLLGTAVHAHLETYIKTGHVPSPDETPARVFLDALPLIPSREGAYAEHSIAEGPRYGGKPVHPMSSIDILHDTYDPDRPTVIDLKTGGNRRRYAPSASELKDDTQAILYGTYGIWRWNDELEIPADTVRFMHINVSTRFQHEPFTTDVVLDRATLEAGRRRVEQNVQAMQQVFDEPTVKPVPRTLSACDAYGGCPFRSACFAEKPLTESHERNSTDDTNTPAETSMPSLLERMRQRRKTLAERGSLPAPAQTDYSETDASPPGSNAIAGAEHRAAQSVRDPRLPVEPPPTPPPTVPPRAAAEGVTPPETAIAESTTLVDDENKPAKAPDPVDYDAALRAQQGTKRRPVRYRKRLASLGYTDDQVKDMDPHRMHAVLDCQVAATDYPDVFGTSKSEPDAASPRGIPEYVFSRLSDLGYNRAEIEAMPDLEMSRIYEARIPKDDPPAPAQRILVQPSRVVDMDAVTDGYTLCIDCVPMTHSVTDVDVWAKSSADEVASMLGVPHYRMADYGKGSAMLAGKLSGRLHELTGYVYVDSMSPTAKAALDILVANALLVLRKV